MRAALYWAPSHDHPLSLAGAAWLGRDAELGVAVRQPDVPGIAEWTAEPRRYGFHATLQAPVRLASPYAAFVEAAGRAARACQVFPLPRLVVSEVDGFLALVTDRPCPEMQALADACVRETDSVRAAPDGAELARRRRAGLSARQEALLVRWGYPYVMEEFRFHMTLTRRLTAEEMAWVRPVAERYFAGVLEARCWMEDVCVFTERAPGADLLIAERIGLAGSICIRSKRG